MKRRTPSAKPSARSNTKTTTHTHTKTKTKPRSKPKPGSRPRSLPAPAPASSAVSLREADVTALRAELERAVTSATPPKWNADPEEVQRSVAKLVLTLVEFLRKLMERQAIRRMDENTLDDDEIERVGQALMKLEETVRDIATRFGLDVADLNLDLGPIGKLM